MQDPTAARIRRFSRAVTTALGVRDQSFRGRGRPLGIARVLNAVGQGRRDVAELRAYLGLDSGQLSRALRQLEDEGLILTTPDPEDARRRTAHLTPAGQAEFTEYETLSDSHALALISGARHPERILAAMDLLASTLAADRITIQPTTPGSEQALYCLNSYFAELAARFSTGFDQHLSCDPEAADLTPPRGTFLLALSDGAPLGCVALKGTDKGYAEVKRLWIAPAARGLGLSRQLMTRIEDEARTLGYDLLRLDTNSALPEALALYRTSGWTEIDRFNDDPYPDHFFEKRLD